MPSRSKPRWLPSAELSVSLVQAAALPDRCELHQCRQPRTCRWNGVHGRCGAGWCMRNGNFVDSCRRLPSGRSRCSGLAKMPKRSSRPGRTWANCWTRPHTKKGCSSSPTTSRSSSCARPILKATPALTRCDFSRKSGPIADSIEWRRSPRMGRPMESHAPQKQTKPTPRDRKAARVC